MSTRILAIFLLAIAQLFPASASAGEEVCSVVSGAAIIAQDDENTFLGKITNAYDSNSIFNDYGTHGSKYSSSSIWNSYGAFGSEYSSYSPFNKYTSTPPMIIKNRKIIGYLSANKSLGSAISPNLLKALCKDEL
ncbi:hypothetical protein LJB71_11425 [Thermomonas sp. S9]|uniref:hypothetical protein n=1 Tax=Thermomonas sp. S9 TaxID=2885203 RepID=UPI00216B10CE|nr:hypothetical protein [Thermomonas sp. S9]MCR6496758.1 hypothetical protein [Thermomonas sp. S9]